MSVIELSRFLGDYADIDRKMLQPMIYEHAALFDVYKIEKDFLLTVLLIYLGKHHPELIFKGGTCLNKIYFEYYRLSEDLDFTVVTAGGRSERKIILEGYKQIFNGGVFASLGLTFMNERTKFDSDRQGIFQFHYNSWIDQSEQTIKIDIRIEPELLMEPVEKPIHAIFTDPIYGTQFFHEHQIKVMHLDEVFAEKTRAALTRDPTAIRDFFDIRYAKKQGFDFSNIRELIAKKVAQLPYTIDDAYMILAEQIDTELNPVLEMKNRELFTLKEIYDFILTLKPQNAQ